MGVLSAARAVPRRDSEVPSEFDPWDGVDAKTTKNAESPGEPVCRRKLHAIPSLCPCPHVCPVLGICGRDDCISIAERAAFAAAVVVARSPTNPHRVPDFGPRPPVPDDPKDDDFEGIEDER